MKPAFFRIGERIVNRYEVREVQLGAETTTCAPTATVTYKDGSKVKVRGCRVPLFVEWILDKEIKPFSFHKDYNEY